MGNVAMRAKIRNTRGWRARWHAYVRRNSILDLLRRRIFPVCDTFSRCVAPPAVAVTSLPGNVATTTPETNTAARSNATTLARAVISTAKCRKCGRNPRGKLSCCAPGGYWLGKCGDEGENKEHTWSEGLRACKRKGPIMKYICLHRTSCRMQLLFTFARYALNSEYFCNTHDEKQCCPH